MKFWRYLLIWGTTSACFGAVEWSRFRGPNGTGVNETSGLPVEIGPDQNMVWKTALPPGYSSPVIGGNRIFVTAFEGKKLLLVCLDRASGKILWQREVPHSREKKSEGRNTPVSPSPVTDGENVYAFFEDLGLISYAADGHERWRLPLGPFNNPYGMAASPVLARGKLLQLCDQDTNSFLIAVDPTDGRVAWKTERPEATHGFSTPVIYQPAKGAAQAIVSGSYQVAGYSVETGEKLWWVRGMAWQAKSVPVVDGDMLYVHSWMASPEEIGLKKPLSFEQVVKSNDANHDGRISRDEAPDPEMKKLWFLFDLNKDGYMDEREWNLFVARGEAGNGVFAIRLGGTGDVTDTNVVWHFNKSMPNIPSPLLYKGVLYVLREGGILTTTDPSRGSILKQGRIEGALDTYYASPVAADGKVFTLSESCKLGVLEAGREWRVLAVNDLKDECWATPAIAESRLYVRTESALYCFGKRG